MVINQPANESSSDISSTSCYLWSQIMFFFKDYTHEKLRPANSYQINSALQVQFPKSYSIKAFYHSANCVYGNGE